MLPNGTVLRVLFLSFFCKTREMGKIAFVKNDIYSERVSAFLWFFEIIEISRPSSDNKDATEKGTVAMHLNYIRIKKEKG